MRRPLPPGVRTPARIRGGEEGANPVKDGPRERMVGARKWIKRKTATGKVLQVSLCLGGVKEGRMKSEPGGMVGMQASLQKVGGRIARDPQRGMRLADSPTPGINSTNSSSSRSHHRHHRQRLPAPGEAHLRHRQAASGLPVPAGAAGRSPQPRRMRSPAAGRSHPHSQLVGRWTSMMARQRGETLTVTTTRM